MKQITQLGATVEEAISIALQQLNTTRNEVEVEVLQEAKKGFFGFGARQAEVRITVKEVESENTDQDKSDDVHHSITEKISVVQEDIQEQSSLSDTIEDPSVFVEEQEDPIESARKYIEDIARDMGIEDLTIVTQKQGKNILFKLESEKAALLIGKRGATLNALQQLAQLVVNKTAKSFLMVKLDVEDYRERRQKALEVLAERMADKAIHTQKKVAFEPMPSYERKVIHNALANRVDIETYSEGTEPNRYLVIEPIR
ncbi:RNA-binding cell elongation regulator Jag/EloR [Ureibacillus sinduriensis]|uniref:RNA-binding protein KhpB n=1 Tax=Ureibacillus sinduriensis BLB-1 = JCM 15800 TaxID=1384057 RepID=A0A0A3IKU0_9BACL|nr:RNA-binding cell elongation regulator Jag/EloR [Ureibacillus sinduriensis]KGR75452.1 protein jag [Ureibacillus sinduriensis BLB-1 = JCM 15800]